MSSSLDNARHLYASSGQHVIDAPREVLDDPAKRLPSVVLVDGPTALWVVPESLLTGRFPLHYLDDEVLDDYLDEVRHEANRDVPASIAR